MATIININKGAIEAKISRTFKSVLPQLTELVLADCNEYCKRADGALIASSLIHTRFDDGIMIWQTPYARRQYWEIQTAHTDKNPRATWKWVHVAKSKNMEKWTRQAAKLMGASK
jgi:Minor capsid.